MREATRIVLLERGPSRLVSAPIDQEGFPLIALVKTESRVMLTLRGEPATHIEYYSWLWVGGKHGGRQLQTVYNGANTIVFLKQEGPYWRTVGDYLACDLPLGIAGRNQFLSDWNAGVEQRRQVLERLAALAFRVDQMQVKMGHSKSLDLIFQLRGPVREEFIDSLLDQACRMDDDARARDAACQALVNIQAYLPPAKQ